MTTVPDLIRARRQRKHDKEKSVSLRLKRAFLALAVIICAAAAASAVLLALVYNHLTRDLPSLQALSDWLDPRDGLYLQPSKILDRSGEVLLLSFENPAASRREYLAFDELPARLIHATVAAADPGFWSHPGFRLDSGGSGGAATLAERLVDDYLLWQEPPGTRRQIRRRMLAAQITQFYGREQILEWYLNTANYAHFIQGVDAASRVYFGKPAGELSQAEAATLAGVGAAPDLNPFDAPELARDRRDQVLQTMFELGYLDAEEMMRALEAPLQVAEERVETRQDELAFLQRVFSDLSRLLPEDRLARGGLRVITTLDAELQAQASCALRIQLGRLGDQDESALPVEGGSCETARLLPTVALGPGERVRDVAGDLVVLDPRSAQILALASLDQEGSALAQLRDHEPGSLLAPYVYLSAFTRGFSPASLVWDIPATLPAGLTAAPSFDREYHGPMRMRTALANDYLGPTLALLAQLGPENVWNTTMQLGFPSLEVAAGAPSQMLLLQGGAMDVLEMSHAFGMFSMQGILFGYAHEGAADQAAAPLEPISILRVEDLNGTVLFETPHPQARPLISTQLAYLLTDVLSDEAARWPSFGHPNALEIGRPVAVKTGFTADRRNAWTIGLAPDLVVGVWVGKTTEIEDSSGQVRPEMAGSIWHAVIQFALQDKPHSGWDTPPGISRIDVCDPSGLLPTPECPLIVKEVFMPGSEPTQSDLLYRKIQINRETGLLATIFTPPALIEERVYLVPPPDAVAWAQNAGFDTPPESYDLVSDVQPASPFVRLTSPEMFASVHGPVSIRGTASGSDFLSYRIQVGQGLNPQQWVQIGQESTTPVEAGQLAHWDTSGLSGLYVIRLQVLRTDQRVETNVLQVTVDNQGPQVEILYPAEGQQFRHPQDQNITVQAVANDDLALGQVEIYVDDELLVALTRAPFVTSWKVRPGEHTLRAVATDLAGNQSDFRVTIFVNR